MMTCFMHNIPLELSGKVMDYYCIAGVDIVDYLLLTLLEHSKTKLLSFEDQNHISTFFKEKMMEEYMSEFSIADLLVDDEQDIQ